jgi:hypothetical protein
MIRLPTALVFASSLLAQGGPTFVVDAANGPGTNYVDVQAAVLAAPDGSVLLVRPGSYAPVTIDGKGVTVLADSSFTIQGSLQILNTQPQQRVLVRGFVIFGYGNNVVLSSAAGPVTVDAAGQTLSSHGWGQFGLGVYSSQQVVIRNCGVQGAAYAPACVVSNSSVVFENCVLMGAPSMLTSQGGGPLATPGLYATGSAVQFVHSSAAGGAGFVWSWMGIPMSMPAAEAITLNGGSLRAMGLPTHAIAGGTHPTQPQSPSITGTGVARVAPAISLSGLPTGVSLTRPPMPSLLADSAAPGGVLTVQRAGPPGVLCVVVVSLRAVPSSVPWLPDPIWLDMPGMLVEAAGIAPASGVFTVTKVVPNNLSLSGFEFVWQSADLDATGVLAVSNPSPSVVL